MVRFRSKLVIMMAFGGAILLAAPTPVKAVPVVDFAIRFIDVDAGNFTIEIHDGGPGDDTPKDGLIKTGASVVLLPNFTIATSSSKANYADSIASGGGVPSTTFARLTQGETAIVNTDPAGVTHELRIIVSATGFTSPDPVTTIKDSASMTIDSEPVGSSVSPATGQSFDSKSDVLFSLDIPNTLLVISGSAGDSTSDNNPETPIAGGPEPNPYTISNEYHAFFSPHAQTVSTGVTTTKSNIIPGPAGLALVLGGLPFLGVSWLRRRGKKQA